MNTIDRVFLTLSAVLVGVIVLAAEPEKPLTNADVIKMIKAELKEETIVLAIQKHASDFDTSVDGLIALKKEGASQKVLDAMLAAKGSQGTEVGHGLPARNGQRPNPDALMNAASAF